MPDTGCRATVHLLFRGVITAVLEAGNSTARSQPAAADGSGGAGSDGDWDAAAAAASFVDGVPVVEHMLEVYQHWFDRGVVLDAVQPGPTTTAAALAPRAGWVSACCVSTPQRLAAGAQRVVEIVTAQPRRQPSG